MVLECINKELNDVEEGSAPMKEELLGGRSRAGPASVQYKVQRRVALGSLGSEEMLEFAEKQFQDLYVGSIYVTTICAISSAVVKLGKLARARAVCRGFSR